jgi:hypothetical protein
MEENMPTFKIVFVCALAGALMVCNVATLYAALLPTNVTAIKSMVAESSIRVRVVRPWRGGEGGYRGYRGWGWGGAALAGAVVGGAIASNAYGYYDGPYSNGYYPWGNSYYPSYVVVPAPGYYVSPYGPSYDPVYWIRGARSWGYW